MVLAPTTLIPEAFRHVLRRSVSLIALSCLLTTPVLAQSKDNATTLLQADKISYDQNKDLITASGKVEIISGEQILRANKIVYDKAKDIVRAEGDVSVLQPNGDVMFADFAEVTSDMKQGFVNKVSVLFSDNSRMAAQVAQRYEGRYLVADRGVYSACDLCKTDPAKPPLWQLKAKRVTHDNVAKDVVYRDAWLEMGGVPIFFTPYFSHPDPTVKRRQGFLTPTAGYTKDLGLFTRIPYYFDIAPNTDATLSPSFSTEDKFQFAGQVRHRFNNGSMIWDGSFTHAKLINEFGVDEGQTWRGHLFGNSLFNLNHIWRAGTDVAIASDKSYLRRYNFSSEDVLLNRGYLEGFKGRHYAAVNSYYFQDTRPGKQQAEPVVAPELVISALGDPGKTLGGRWSLNGGMLVTTRDRETDFAFQGADTRRLSLGGGWERDFISTTGFITNLSGLTRIDGYWADNVRKNGVKTPQSSNDFHDVAEQRQYAQASLLVRYPFGRRGEHEQQIFEPIAVITAAPRLSSNTELPNEDSLDVEFDETNLFRPNRFTGTDRLESGNRAAYGIRHSIIGDNGVRVEFVGGQVYRFIEDKNFPTASGLRTQLSDYVGRLDLVPGSWLDANYGFRIDRDSLRIRRQELTSSAGAPIFRPFVRYIAVDQAEATTGVTERVSEITSGFTSTFQKFWTVNFSHRRALAPEAGARNTSIGLTYQDECARFGLTFSQDNTSRADVDKGTTVLFSFYLRNIGGFDSGSNDASGFGK